MTETKTNTTNDFTKVVKHLMKYIPEPDHTFTYGDIYGANHLGLQGKGGVYRFYDGEDLVYVGVSNNIGGRLSDHKKTKQNGVSTLVAKLMADGATKEEARDYLNTLTVKVILEEVEAYQYICSNVFIAEYSPKYNTDGKKGGRSNNKVYDMDINKVIYDYTVLKKNMADIADEIGCHYTTVSEVLRKNGVVTRNTNAKHIGIDTNEAWELWLQGKSYSEIGAILNCAPSSARYHVRKKKQQLEKVGA